ncbi:hypothetical protein ACFE04_029083 [Oxalis oulophora]
MKNGLLRSGSLKAFEYDQFLCLANVINALRGPNNCFFALLTPELPGGLTVLKRPGGVVYDTAFITGHKRPSGVAYDTIQDFSNISYDFKCFFTKQPSIVTK